ncbi:cytochrome c-type biogenesis protein [Shimia abyssi]|uniref:Cytochrome c-type biogenesis protein n=1 Tax=Shimia abyssi TaxID=1662395 RepID=A0A2P8FG85_9RHOB|nr:cytochrome c-type biogenesis protein [Shimia abyssi]PSL20718.1 cytochrome c-type biogenesis protein CcmH [Shimia abyssi]
MRLILSAIFALLVAMPVWAVDADEMFADPALEERAREVGRQLRCLKCRNQSIFDSNAGIAKDLRVAVRDRMVAGDSDQEILEYVRVRFGDYVLMKPPVEGHTYLLWMTPVVLMLLAGVGFAGYMRGRSSACADHTLSDTDRAEAQRILKEGGAS